MANYLASAPSSDDNLASLICSGGESTPDMTDLSLEWKNRNWLSDGEKQRLLNAQ